MDESELDVPASAARAAPELHFSSVVLDDRSQPVGSARRASRQPAEEVHDVAGGRAGRSQSSPPVLHCDLLPTVTIGEPMCKNLYACTIACVVETHTSATTRLRLANLPVSA